LAGASPRSIADPGFNPFGRRTPLGEPYEELFCRNSGGWPDANIAFSPIFFVSHFFSIFRMSQ
jgi:hypothetical protein